MKLNHNLRLIFTVATFCLFISSVSADELPDFSGVWAADKWATEPWPVKPPFTEKGQAEQDAWAADPLDDPTHLCVFHLVRITSAPFLHEIIQQDDRITILYEYQHQVRRVFLDGRNHPEDPLLSLMGHSTGKIEGNTLTIDTVGVEAGYLRPQAFPHGENIHVIEKHTLLEPGKKRIEMTIDDPEYYREPIMVTMDWSKTDDEILDYDCRVRPHLNPFTE
jgi:hypothetical protein